MQTYPIKMTLPMQLPTNNISQPQFPKVESFNDQGSNESVSRIIQELSLDFDKTKCDTSSLSTTTTIHSRSRSLSYHSATETRLDQISLSAKSSVSGLLSLTRRLSFGTGDDDTSTGEHRLLARLKYATVS
ncbi:unnamed protein product [Trichobilharzia regenti]|nr:unnamed protein product [Trichobilharzia regenti]